MDQMMECEKVIKCYQVFKFRYVFQIKCIGTWLEMFTKVTYHPISCMHPIRLSTSTEQYSTSEGVFKCCTRIQYITASEVIEPRTFWLGTKSPPLKPDPQPTALLKHTHTCIYYNATRIWGLTFSVQLVTNYS